MANKYTLVWPQASGRTTFDLMLSSPLLSLAVFKNYWEMTQSRNMYLNKQVIIGPREVSLLFSAFEYKFYGNFKQSVLLA